MHLQMVVAEYQAFDNVCAPTYEHNRDALLILYSHTILLYAANASTECQHQGDVAPGDTRS